MDTFPPDSITNIEQIPIEIVRVEKIFEDFTPGDADHTWAEEFEILRAEHSKEIAALTVDVSKSTGIRVPIVLGYDGRVWDGHHRLAVADALGLVTVPVRLLHRPAESEGKRAHIERVLRTYFEFSGMPDHRQDWFADERAAYDRGAFKSFDLARSDAWALRIKKAVDELEGLL